MPSAFPAKMFQQSELDNYKLQVELLQQKLVKSEEQRQHLEEKFEKIQKKRNEHEKSMKAKSRNKFEKFLEEQRERNERNKQIVKMLEHIDQQAVLLSQRSGRLRAMKLQYELYFAKLLQAQALRFQNTPRYSILPMNQFISSTQPNQQQHQLSTAMISGGVPSTLSNTGIVQPTNIYNSSDDLSKQNISSILNMPTTPATAPENWNFLSNNSNGGVNNNQNSIPSVVPSGLGNDFTYRLQPNQFDYYNGSIIFNHPNAIQTLTQPSPVQWGIPIRSNVNTPVEAGNSTMSLKPNIDDMSHMMLSQKSISPNKSYPSNQRTFKDFERNKNMERRYYNENVHPNEQLYGKTLDDELNLLREQNYRNRLRRFNDTIDSNENLSGSEQNPENSQYNKERKDTMESFASRRQQHSFSRSSTPDKILSIIKQDEGNTNNNSSSSGRPTSSMRERLPSNSQISDSRNNDNDREIDVKVKDFEKLQTMNLTKNIQDDRKPNENRRISYTARNELGSRQEQERTTDNIDDVKGFSMNNDSKMNNPGNSIMNNDKDNRRPLLKKIHVPEYLLPDSEKSISNGFIDSDRNRLQQPITMNSPGQFAKKEKLSIENIENAIYGELINPQMSMMSTTKQPVSAILKQHQPPSVITGQPIQVRKSEILNTKLTDFKEIIEPETNYVEKIDLSEKSQKINIEKKPLLSMSGKVIENTVVPAKPVDNSLKIVPPVISDEPKPIVEINKEENINANNGQFSDGLYQNVTQAEQQPQLEQNFSNIDEQPTQNSVEPIYDYAQPETQTNIDHYGNNNDVADPDNQYTNEGDQPTLDTTNTEGYDATQIYDPNENQNVYEEQQQYAGQDYQQYPEQTDYSQDQQFQPEGYQDYQNPEYQPEYDPNTYEYNYDQQQPVDPNYAYDPSQQYEGYDQTTYQDPNYDASNSEAYQPNYDQSDQQQIAGETNPENYLQSDDTVVQPEENLQIQPQEESIADNSENISTPETDAVVTQPAKPAVRPILAKEKSVDVENKKKKRVNFVDTSDDSSSKQQTPQQQQPTTDDSDFDFSSQ